MANSLTFTQVSTILNTMLSQAQGRTDITTALDERTFVAQANTLLQMGYEQFMNAMSQTLSKTIFSIRPYSRKLKGLYADEIRYGNHVRKVSPIDGQFENDTTKDLTDGTSVDPWTINKPKAIQFNWYGQNIYQVSKTFPKDQIDTAVTGSEQFGQFITMVLSNVSDMIEQKHEETARATLVNLIGAKVKADSTNVIYLVDQYKTEKGIVGNFDYRSPSNYGDFARWLFGFIQTFSDKLEERSVLYHMNVTGKYINRHTPKSEQIMYLFAPVMNSIANEVKSTTFSTEFLASIDYERVMFWQSPLDPAKINVIPNYIGSNGQIASDEDSTPVELDNVFGILFDREAAGYTTINTWSQSTGINAKGGYSNTFWHFTDRPWVDMTENAVVFVLGSAPVVPPTPTPTYVPVTPVGTENPSEEGWYEKSGDNYILTEDTSVVEGKTYYEQVVTSTKKKTTKK